MTASGRVDFVGHAGGEQADGAELVGLRELGFKRDALGDVVDQDDAAHGNKIAREQRRDGDVGGALLAGARGERGICRGDARRARCGSLRSRRRTPTGKTEPSAWPRASARLRAYMASICAFQLSMRSSRSRARMPTLMDSTMFSLNSLSRSNSPIFSSKARVEAGVLQGDADVAGEGLEQLHIFAGEEVAADGAAEADDGNGARWSVRRPAAPAARGRQVVVQVEQRGCALLLAGQMQGLLARFRGRCASGPWPGRSREIRGPVVLSVAPRRAGHAKRRGAGRRSPGSARKTATRDNQERARQALDDGVEQGLEIGFGAEAAAELDQRLAVVVAMAVKGAIDPALDAALERVEDGSGDQDGDDQAPLAHGLRQPLWTSTARQGDDAEVAAEQQAVASV